MSLIIYSDNELGISREVKQLVGTQYPWHLVSWWVHLSNLENEVSTPSLLSAKQVVFDQIVDKISWIEDRKFSRGLNFANQPVFHLISFIFLGVLANSAISKISSGQNFVKMAKIRENREN